MGEELLHDARSVENNLLTDELSLGLAPRLVERLGEALLEINRAGISILLVEQAASC